MRPFFSIVIPLYNKEHYIKNTIKSVLNQTFQNFEIIIINDGSTDKSVEKVKNFKDSRIKFLSQRNRGVSYARNYGIENSSGKFIVFLDADDLFKKKHLNKLYLLIAEYPRAKVYSTSYLTKYSKNSIKESKFRSLKSGFRGYINNYFHVSVFDEILRIGNAAFDKAIFSNSNMFFDEKMKSGQDTDLWIRIGLNFKIAIDTTALTLIHKKTYNSLSNSQHVNNRILMLDKYKEQEKANADLKKYIDQNRFAIALQYRLNKNYDVSKSILKDIDFKHLNLKQKTLINSPFFLISTLLRIKNFMDSKNIFLSLYR